jgi:DnaJ-class molecular chaperone
LESSATYDEVKTAYRRRSRLLHPDRAGDDEVLREEAERAMVGLNAAWSELQAFFDHREARGVSGEWSESRANDDSTSYRRDSRGGQGDDFEVIHTHGPEACLDWVLGALLEGGEAQGDPLSAGEIRRVTQPIFKEVGRSSFDVWFAQRTGTMQAAFDADVSDADAVNTWMGCYEWLEKAECDKVIMMLLDEVLVDGPTPG